MPPFGFNQVRNSPCEPNDDDVDVKMFRFRNLSCLRVSDFNYKYKLATGNDEVESCQPNPCQNDGKCVSSGNLNRCQCVGHFTGRLVSIRLLSDAPVGDRFFFKWNVLGHVFQILCAHHVRNGAVHFRQMRADANRVQSTYMARSACAYWIRKHTRNNCKYDFLFLISLVSAVSLFARLRRSNVRSKTKAVRRQSVRESWRVFREKW